MICSGLRLNVPSSRWSIARNPKMSDFKARIEEELSSLLARQILHKGEVNRFLVPMGGFAGLQIANHIDRFYYGDEQALRYPSGPSFLDWRPVRSKPSRKNETVRNLASRLGRSERDICRKLVDLRAAGEIPSDWFDGHRWTPPFSDALRILSSVMKLDRKRHSHEVGDDFVGVLKELREERLRIEGRITELLSIRATCDLLAKTTFTTQTAPNSIERDRSWKAHETMVYGALEGLAVLKDWKFCKVLAIATSLVKEGVPVAQEAVARKLGVHRRTVQRHFLQELEFACQIAPVLLQRPELLPMVLEDAQVRTDEDPIDEFSEVMSGWNAVVNYARLRRLD